MSTNIPRIQIDGLRASDTATIAAKVSDVLRQHLDGVNPTVVADLFAISELKVPASLAADLRSWSITATQQLRDMHDNVTRGAWLNDISLMEDEKIPARLREAVLGLLPGSGGAVVEQIEALAVRWAETAPEVLVLPKKARASSTVPKVAKEPKAVKEAKAPRVIKAPRTPKADVDPRRAEWVREDAVTRLNASEYAERGLKESIFLSGIRKRCPYTDMTDEEIKVHLRKLEREGKVKHTGERWLAR